MTARTPVALAYGAHPAGTQSDMPPLDFGLVTAAWGFGLTTLVVALLFGAIFKVLPDYHIPWHVVWQSALLTAVLYMIGKSLIAMYLGTTALASSYGAAGAVVLILVWMYYSAQVFLYGAELSRQMVLAHAGEHPDDADAALGAQKVLSPKA